MLSHYFRLTVPSTVDKNVSNTEKQSFCVDHIATEFAKMFGGFSSYAGFGGWVSKDKGLIKESVIFVESWCSYEQFKKYQKAVLKLAYWLCSEMSQEAVALQINKKLQFVTAITRHVA